jgi:hypothetical protein
MAMTIRKVTETPETITLGWDPVPGCDGYRFYSAGVLRSKTMDPTRKTVKFSKGQEPYKIEAVVLVQTDSGTYPSAPVTFKKVAPRVAYKQDGSDARYCLWAGAEGGALRPGLSYINPSVPAQGVRDEVAQYSLDGLCLGSERTGGSQADGLVGAKEIDGRALCSLPMTGDPTKNTGSWKI